MTVSQQIVVWPRGFHCSTVLHFEVRRNHKSIVQYHRRFHWPAALDPVLGCMKFLFITLRRMITELADSCLRIAIRIILSQPIGARCFTTVTGQPAILSTFIAAKSVAFFLSLYCREMSRSEPFVPLFLRSTSSAKLVGNAAKSS